jgi:hypothetical protein
VGESSEIQIRSQKVYLTFSKKYDIIYIESQKEDFKIPKG